MNAVLQPQPEDKGGTADATPIDAVDRRIILATQAGLPRVAQPYHALARELGVSADEVMTRLRRMQHIGVIRRIGAVPNHYKLGYLGNGMSVWDVPDNQVQQLGQRIGALPFVSHCYQRPRHLPHWSYNLFAMVHGKDRVEVMQQVHRIADMLGSIVRDYDVLFSTRILKKTGLRLHGQ